MPNNNRRIIDQGFLQTIIASSMDGFLLMDMSCNIISANDSYYQMTGYGPDEIVSRHISEFDLQFSVEETDNLAKLLVRTGRLRFETRQRHKNGTILDIEVSANYSPLNGGFLFSFIRDITERKIAEAMLRYHGEVVKNMAEGIVQVHFDSGIILFANQRFEKMFGYEAGELGGKDVKILNAPSVNTPEETRDSIMVALKETGEWHGEIENIRKDGTRFWSYVNTSVFDSVTHGKICISVHDDISERKAAQEALQKSQRHLNYLIDNSPMAMIEWNSDYVVTRWAGEAEQIFGWSAAEVIGRPIMDLKLVYEEDIPLVQEMLSSLADPESRYVVSTNRNYTKDHEIIYCEWYNTGLSGPDGKLISVLSQVLDITERKILENALQESYERFCIFMDNSPSIAWMKDVEGRYIYMNRSYEQHMNVRLTDMRGKTDFHLFPQDIAEQFRKNDRVVVDSGKPLEIIEESIDPSGERNYWWSSKFPIKDSAGRRFIGGVGINITERKHAEEALQKASAYMRSLIEASLDPLVTINPDGIITDANEASSKVSGLSREELIGMEFSAYFTDQQRARQGYQKVFSVGSIRDYPLAIRHVSGDITEVLCNATVFKDDNDRVQGVFAAARDVTELNRATRELQKAYDELEERVEERTEELARAHEQMKKISFQLVWAEEKERERIAAELHDRVGQSLLLAKMNLDELLANTPSDSFRCNVESALTLLKGSIEDIRSLTFSMRPPILDTAGMQTTLKWLCSSISKDYKIQVVFECNEQSIEISKENRYTLYHAVRELLLNVAKHAETGKALLQVVTDENTFQVNVIDNGVGFDHTGCIMKHMNNGGYGLYNVQQRIEQLGGRFVVNSAPGKGTTVLLSVPLTATT